MTLKPVPGPGKDDRPLWEKPFIPIKKSEDGRDAPAGTKITKAQRRYIDVLVQSGKRPEVQTISDFIYTGFYLAQEYFARTTPNSPELQAMAELDQMEALDSWRRARYAKAEKWLDDIQHELGQCVDASGNPTKPGRFLEAWNSFDRGRKVVPDDFKSEANRIWLKYRDIAKPLQGN